MDQIKYLFEQWGFAWFSFWGDLLGITTRRIRFFFIYVSFIAVSSPLLLVVMIGHFFTQSGRFFRKRGDRIWDL